MIIAKPVPATIVVVICEPRGLSNPITMGVVELSRQMSSSKDLVVEPSQLGSLKGLNGTKDTRIILVRPLTLKVKAYSS